MKGNVYLCKMDYSSILNLLKCEVSLFLSVFSREAQRCTLGSVLKSFASRRYEKTVREAREYLKEGNQEMYKACKSMLPVVAFSGLFEKGHSKSNLVRYNNIVIIDIDHLTEEALPLVRQQLQQDEYVFAYWLSPSGQGLKGLVRISDGDGEPLDEHHRQAFRQLSAYFESTYAITIDPSGSDYSRLCYACWDEELVVKEQARVFVVEKALRPPEGGVSAPPSGGRGARSSRVKNRQTNRETLQDILQYLQQQGRSITRDYENWVRVAYALACTFTRKPGLAYFLQLSRQDADKYDEAQCRKTFDYCYDHSNGDCSFGTIVYLAQKAGYTGQGVAGQARDAATDFSAVAISEFVDIILAGGERGDEAMYYLLRQRLKGQLRERFEVYQHLLLDDFDDVVEDFFLYLREGNSHPSDLQTAPLGQWDNGRNTTLYPSLYRIRKKELFATWVINTFRNYLILRAAAERKMTYTRLADENIAQVDGVASPLTDERKLAIASSLIAYTHQVLRPRERFIFLRTLLTMLNKQQALPNDEMADALGMSSIAYRVTVHRIKGLLASLRTRLLRGERLPLDEPHSQMARHINDDFTHLYPTLGQYYIHSLDTLQCADTVKRLREEYYNATGAMLHEPGEGYSAIPTIAVFWTRLSRFLVV